MRFNREGTLLLTRCLDGTMKLWDVRNTKAPLREVGGLETNSAQTQAIFSPDEGLVVTAINSSRDGTSGAVAFYETSTFKLVRRLGVSSGSAVALQWHPRLNQIIVGAGGAKARLLTQSANPARVLSSRELAREPEYGTRRTPAAFQRSYSCLFKNKPHRIAGGRAAHPVRSGLQQPRRDARRRARAEAQGPS